MQFKLLFILQVLTSLYLLINRIFLANYNSNLDFLITLVYLILAVSMELVGKSGLKMLFGICACLIICVSGSWFLLPLFPFLVATIGKEYKSSFAIYLLLIPPLFIFPQLDYPFYCFISILVILLQFLDGRHFRSFKSLEHELYRAEKENSNFCSNFSSHTRQANETEHLHRLEERNLISQKIHDQIGHVLSGTIYQLEAVKILLDEDPVKSREMIKSCSENLRDGLEDLRQGVRLIKPSIQDIKIQQIREMLVRFGSANMINVRIDIPESGLSPGSLPFDVIMANLLEGLTNILKHSNAGEIEFSISKFNKFIRVRLMDDGSGCQKLCFNLGLQGMEERTEAAGGQFIADGSRGFSITMIFEGEVE